MTPFIGAGRRLAHSLVPISLVGVALALTAACSDDDDAASGGSTQSGGAGGSGGATGGTGGAGLGGIGGTEQAAVDAVSPDEMKATVDFLAADELGGRIPGSVGHLTARDYLAAKLNEIGLEPFGDDGGYLHSYPSMGRSSRFQLEADGSVVPNTNDTGYNLVGRIEGSDPELKDEYVVLMAHYDHLGVEEDGTVFNGAFDNAGGTALLVEMARVMVAADVKPKRSLVFLLTDDEENGLTGAQMWVTDPPVPKDKIVAGISADPVGRNLLPDYGPIVLSGLERSPALHALWRQTEGFTEREVVYLHRQMIPVFASDQDEFHAVDLPGAWYITPGMSFYHTVDDDADTIDYRLMLDTTRYLIRASLAVTDAQQSFPYEGEPALDMAAARDVKRILMGVLASSVLDDTERQTVQGFVDDADRVIEAESWDVIGSATAYFVRTVGFVAFQLPAKYPGQVPPPFPQ